MKIRVGCIRVGLRIEGSKATWGWRWSAEDWRFRAKGKFCQGEVAFFHTGCVFGKRVAVGVNLYSVCYRAEAWNLCFVCLANGRRRNDDEHFYRASLEN